ncbi:MAG: fructosamine kinase family protein [Mangrovicoccus sp.]|nr:fructosamine kinase family protein [Mangrovicoccus sp.]
MSALAEKITALTGEKLQRLTPLQGGDLSAVYRAELADGQSLVVKTAPGAGREARMLRAMAEAGAPVPEVLAHEGDLLLLADLGALPGLAGNDPAAWQALAQAITSLQQARGPYYGWEEDHSFGPVKIINQPAQNWAKFWAEQRILAPAQGLDHRLRHRLERLCAKLEDLMPAAPAPSLLHGDLWVGNILCAPNGQAYLIDPACYWGDYRVDLAMLCFFARPPEAFWQAQDDLGPDWSELCALYQLWPALVHLRLFGSGYYPHVDGILARFGL